MLRKITTTLIVSMLTLGYGGAASSYESKPHQIIASDWSGALILMAQITPDTIGRNAGDFLDALRQFDKPLDPNESPFESLDRLNEKNDFYNLDKSDTDYSSNDERDVESESNNEVNTADIKKEVGSSVEEADIYEPNPDAEVSGATFIEIADGTSLKRATACEYAKTKAVGVAEDGTYRTSCICDYIDFYKQGTGKAWFCSILSPISKLDINSGRQLRWSPSSGWTPMPGGASGSSVAR